MPTHGIVAFTHGGRCFDSKIEKLKQKEIIDWFAWPVGTIKNDSRAKTKVIR